MRKSVPSYILPEKEEIGVVVRADRIKPLMVIDLEKYLLMLSIVKKATEEK